MIIIQLIEDASAAAHIFLEMLGSHVRRDALDAHRCRMGNDNLFRPPGMAWHSIGSRTVRQRTYGNGWILKKL